MPPNRDLVDFQRRSTATPSSAAAAGSRKRSARSATTYSSRTSTSSATKSHIAISDPIGSASATPSRTAPDASSANSKPSATPSASTSSTNQQNKPPELTPSQPGYRRPNAGTTDPAQMRSITRGFTGQPPRIAPTLHRPFRRLSGRRSPDRRPGLLPGIPASCKHAAAFATGSGTIGCSAKQSPCRPPCCRSPLLPADKGSRAGAGALSVAARAIPIVRHGARRTYRRDRRVARLPRPPPGEGLDCLPLSEGR
jgi:hypothetical protein